MSAAATGAPSPFLSTHAFEQDIPPSVADGVANLLAQDRQIVIVTGKIDGRMGGFLADLSHGIARRGSLLRIKSPLNADEFHAALAGQLNLPAAGDTPGQLAARVGQRLQQPAPKGRYVLLCEGADQYALPTLEAIRQLSNHPVSLVLVGSHALSRRLRGRSLAPLRQRVTHQLALSRRLPTPSFWLALIVLLGGGSGLMSALLPHRPAEDATVPRPISLKPAHPKAAVSARAPSVPGPVGTNVASQNPDLQLLLERELSHQPAPPQ